MRRLLPLLLAVPLLPAAPAHAAVGTYAFSGVAAEGCYGCGVTTGHFAGTFTGVVGDHAYVSAPLVMNYTTVNPTGTCPVTAIASGDMRVSDAVSSDYWTYNWTRSYADVVLATTTGSSNGLFVATYVVTSPVGTGCGGPVTIDMRGTGAGT
jgi:hypothetical protein